MIPCSQYDLLEIAAMRKQAVEIAFENNQPKLTVSIENLYAKQGKDYLLDIAGKEHCLADATSVKLVE